MRFQAWDIVFLAGLVVFFVIRGVFIARTKGNEPDVRRLDAVEIGVQVALAPGILILPLLYLFTPWLAFADYELPPWVSWCGTAVMAGALWLFYRSHADLGLNWSKTLELQKGHMLITHGVYLAIRHPMYASIWLWAVAQGMLLENWLAGWSACAAFAPMYFIRTPREERMMREHFSEEYDAYVRRTGSVLPRLRIKQGPGRSPPG